MSDLEKCGLPRAGRQAGDNALVGIQTNVSIILSQDADAQGCAGYFLHDLDAPCYGLASDNPVGVTSWPS